MHTSEALMPHAIGREKRAYIRGRCNCEAEIIVDDATEERIKIFVVDLAAGGLKFSVKKGGKEYKLNAYYLLKLSIKEAAYTFGDIVSNIKIRRVELGVDDECSYGASFEDLTEEKRRRVNELILSKERAKGYA